MTANEPPHTNESNRLKDAPISRRQFVRLSATTAGAVTLSGVAAADVTSPKLTDLYQFVANRVDDDYEIPTLVELSSPAFDALEPYADEYFRTTTQPTTAAWLRLTPTEVEDVIALDPVSTLRYSPGSNPFWRLGHYPDGAFPPVDDSVDYIDFEQAVDGVQHLAAEHGDRVNVRSWGQSPGHENLFTETNTDPQELWVVEVTNDVGDEASFREKEKVFFSLGIHGDERAGVEAGSRFLERLLEGDEPEIEALLDDVVLLFAYTNPDGWVSRRQEYLVNDDPVGDPDPEHNSFKRATATGVDPNRGYPTVGWINPVYFPAEPDGRNLQDDRPGVDDDVPTTPKDYEQIVPDSLDIVEGLRGYENLSYGSDLHGMFWSSNFIEGLIVNDQYDHEEFHDIYELNRRTKSRMEDELASDLEARRDRFETLNDDYLRAFGIDDPDSPRWRDVLPEPETAYEYGTIFDTIQYTTSATLISWMSQPEDKGGLGVRMIAHEMGWDNRIFRRMTFRPWLADLHVRGYKEAIRSVTEHAARNVSADVRTGGVTTAYVETDALTRSSADLSFGDTDTTTASETVTVGKRWEPVTVSVPRDATELSLTADPQTGPVLAKLRDPSGRVVRTHNTAGNRPRRSIEWSVSSPEAGDWTVELKRIGGGAETPVTVSYTVVLGGDGGTTAPDPTAVFGYEQRGYSVSPLAYFDDYAQYIADSGTGQGGGKGSANAGGGGGSGNLTDAMTGLTVADIENGALFRGQSGQLAVENLVVPHAVGADNDAYLAELDRFVASGGNLVLTDAGVAHLGLLENDLASGVTPDDVEQFGIFIVHFTEREEGHPLLAGTRPVQRELYKVTPLGYPISDAPVTGVDPDTFEGAGGTVAGLTNGRVTAGSITRGDGTGSGIHVVGGLLPPAYQGTAHPFGLLEYTSTYLGHTILTNALGFQQRRFVDGDLAETFGNVD